MFKEKNEQFLELVLAYHNCKEAWMANATRANCLAYRKILKELSKVTKDISNIVMQAQHDRWEENKKLREETGSRKTKMPPKI